MLVRSDVELELRQEQEHVLVVALVLHHVLVHLLKEGLVEGLEVSEHMFFLATSFEARQSQWMLKKNAMVSIAPLI